MAQQPNILLIMTDQHAPKIAGFAGDAVVRTQHLDILARRSVRFNTAICASPVCTPSRMCMLTGKEPHRCAAWGNHWVIFPEHITWPGHFADHGYTTCLVGKMHFGGGDQMQGFQHRPYGDLRHGLGHQPEPLNLFPAYAGAESAGITEIPESLIQDVVVTRETLAFLREHHDQAPDQPWFLCASYGRPHSPYTAPGRYIRYYRDRVPPDTIGPDFLDPLEPYAAATYRNYVPEGGLSAEVSLRAREAYHACVDFVDDCMGELLKGLERQGILENTIVIYTSDHGDMAGIHGLWGKSIYYEPSIGVPLLISGPAIREGHYTVDDPISLIDLFPTACSLAGLPVPDGLDGLDSSGVLANPAGTSATRAFATSSFFRYGTRVKTRIDASQDAPASAMRCVRTTDWKYVEIQGADPLLFDMVNDPLETVNLSGDPDHADRATAMRGMVFERFSWEAARSQLAEDRERVKHLLSGRKPSMPNQYRLPDGREFDAEAELYGARWLHIPDNVVGGGIIPQQFG